jgi:hypothetical protein
MKHRLLFCLLALTAATPVLAANVGISVNIGEPGFYGQLDIGDYPPPALLYPQPVIVSPVVVAQPPSTCACHRAMPGTGIAIAAVTMPAIAGCISCRTSGIARNMPTLSARTPAWSP